MQQPRGGAAPTASVAAGIGGQPVRRFRASRMKSAGASAVAELVGLASSARKGRGLSVLSPVSSAKATSGTAKTTAACTNRQQDSSDPYMMPLPLPLRHSSGRYDQMCEEISRAPKIEFVVGIVVKVLDLAAIL